MEELIRQGHEAIALCPSGEVSHKFAEHGIPHVAYHIVRASLNPMKELGTIRNVHARLKELKPDILHTFTAKPNIYGTIAGDKAKVPVIINTVTGMGSYYLSDSRRARFVRGIMETLYRHAAKKSHGVIFQNGDDLRYFLDKKLCPPEKARLVRSSGVDTAAFDPETVDRGKVDALRKGLELEGRQVVLLVGRTLWDKGIREYARAAEIVREKHPEAVCLLVGGTDRGNPSSAPEEWLNTQAFRWLGHRSDVKELMALSDVVVLPSYREGVPRTLLEASAMGKPMVATDAIGCREVVTHDLNGFLVPLYAGDALGEAVCRLLDDPSLRKRLGTAARKRAVEEFDVKIVIRQYLAAYRELSRQDNNPTEGNP